METKLYLFSLEPFHKMVGECAKRQMEKVAGEIIVKTIFSQLCRCSFEAVEIVREGKPYVKNTSLEYNLSHSGNYLLFAVGDTPLGVDIEKVTHIRKRVMKEYFTKEEKQLVERDGAEAFYKLWTRKESCVKLTGEGIKGLKNIVCISENIGFFTETYGEYVFSVCADSSHLPRYTEVVTELSEPFYQTAQFILCNKKAVSK